MASAVAKPTKLYACYLLTSLHPNHALHTYIGFTVNPWRRIRQHNGEIKNGAWRTRKKRPWKMVLAIQVVLLVHGFPTKIDALRFEWAWQHPEESRLLRDIVATMRGVGHKTKLKARLRIAHELVHQPPFSGYSLTLTCLAAEFREYFNGCKAPPGHMRVETNRLEELRRRLSVAAPQLRLSDTDTGSESDDAGLSDSDDSTAGSEDSAAATPGWTCATAAAAAAARTRPMCALCRLEKENSVRCVHAPCAMTAHLRCLANWFLPAKTHKLLPSVGTCPLCRCEMTWSDAVARLRRRRQRQRALTDIQRW